MTGNLTLPRKVPAKSCRRRFNRWWFSLVVWWFVLHLHCFLLAPHHLKIQIMMRLSSRSLRFEFRPRGLNFARFTIDSSVAFFQTENDQLRQTETGTGFAGRPCFLLWITPRGRCRGSEQTSSRGQWSWQITDPRRVSWAMVQ